MANRTTDPKPGPAVSKSICGRLDDKDGVRRVCVRDPHDDRHHNMVAVSPELARSLARRGYGGPGIDELGTTDVGYFDAGDPTDDSTLVTGNPDVLPAAAPPRDGQAADPAQPTPDVSARASEPTSESTASPAGSGGGSGRPSSLERGGQVAEGRPLARRAADTEASEELVRAGMSVISQPAQADHAIRHSLELARVLKLVETAGSMFADLASGDLVSEHDIRLVRDLAWRMAATRGVDP